MLPALEKQKAGVAAAIQLPDGQIIVERTSPLLGPVPRCSWMPKALAASIRM